MRNSFNFLLIALICMDSCFLVMAICESFRKGFALTSTLHLVMFPYFLYPLLSIAVTASIYMTVAIALERYIAVHYPIDYSQVRAHKNVFYVLPCNKKRILMHYNQDLIGFDLFLLEKTYKNRPCKCFEECSTFIEFFHTYYTVLSRSQLKQSVVLNFF